MWEIIIERQGEKILRRPLGEKALNIGRAPECDLCLLGEEISRQHCRLEPRDGAWFLRDCSRNGTIVNGGEAVEAPLGEGDIITVGAWSLRLTQVNTPDEETLISTPRATQVIAYDPLMKQLSTERWTLTISSPDQPHRTFTLSTTQASLGQHPASTIVVTDPFVSRRHCHLIQDGDGLMLQDAGSTNGTFVDGVRIDRTRLATKGSFTMGKTIISFRQSRVQEAIEASSRFRMGNVIGKSRAMREIFSLIERIAPSSATIAISGESGTGKELIARLLHEQSHRRRGPFVALNCGAIPAAMIEGMLFGHERGAFTGAIERLPGFFEQAHGGTLFLDEIGDMSLDLQSRLLRVLEDGKVRRLGARQEISVDIRLIHATHHSLAELVAAGTFRADLFYRLFVVPVVVPPLRERIDDIDILAHAFGEQHASAGKTCAFTPAALKKLHQHPWPGNVRELRNTIQRAMLAAKTSTIDASDLQFIPQEIVASHLRNLRDNEQNFIEDALRRYKGNQARVARELGVARTTLTAKMKKFGIEVDVFRNKTH